MRLLLNTLLFLVVSFLFFNIAGLEATRVFANSTDVAGGGSLPIAVLASR